MSLLVLLTGGSGFLAAHVLRVLLERGHNVVTTVRSTEKAEDIKKMYPQMPESRLSFVIVKDIADPEAIDAVTELSLPFDAVIHTASPYHYNATDIKKDLLEPAILGTRNILTAIHHEIPSVKRVVITSSFVAVADNSKGVSWDHTYTEADWNPITSEGALANAQAGYQASKTLAEKTAWDFVREQKPSFTVTTLCPPLVFGPIIHRIRSIDALNTSNRRIYNLISSENKTSIPDTGFYLWVDVRDLALAHVRAAEEDKAANKRFLVVGGYFNNREILSIVGQNFEAYRDRLPNKEVPGGGYPEQGVYRFDSRNAEEVLGIHFSSLERCIVDTVASFDSVG